MGAIGEDGVLVRNEAVIQEAGIGEAELHLAEERERVELRRRAQRYRNGRPPLALVGKTVVVVDDGIATGATARAALEVARVHGPDRVIVAVPVAPIDVYDRFATAADEVVVVETPSPMRAVGAWYRDFSPTSDDEVVRLSAGTGRSRAGPVAVEMRIDVDDVRLPGLLTVPPGATGVVVFAHGSGSSRHSPRNRFVAAWFNAQGLGTLLFDLLNSDEETDRAKVFDIALLGRRLGRVVSWLSEQRTTRDLPVGLFGASTGGGAALWAATEPDVHIAAVVSRGGRPDLAAARLGAVRSPTLLIVGGLDHGVVELNRQAARRIRCDHELAIVPGATHLFTEPGALEDVARLAADWFTEHFAP